MRHLQKLICIGLFLVIVGCSTNSRDLHSTPNENSSVQSSQAEEGKSADGEGQGQDEGSIHGELTTEAEKMSEDEGSTSEEAGAASPEADFTSVDGKDQTQGAEAVTTEAVTTEAITTEASTTEAASTDVTSSEAEAEPIEKKRQLPSGFVYVDEVLEHAFYEIRYYSDYNFIGEVIDGYHAPFAILTEKAAKALLKAEQELAKQGYALLIYDAYRPHKAVEQFIEWAADEQDTRMQQYFYPDIDKSKVFELGYLSRRSGHSRGSTIDLTLADFETGEPLDMGGPYDLLGEISSHNAKGLTREQQERRALLKQTMVAAGFEPYSKEWWHYTLKAEPYPKQYFDFDVE